MDFIREQSEQKSNVNLRVAMRKKQLELRKSGFFSDEDSVNVGKKQPLSTRANSFMPRFGGMMGGMMEELAYQPVNSSGAFLQFNKSSAIGKRAPVSTRAHDPMGVINFPTE